MPTSLPEVMRAAPSEPINHLTRAAIAATSQAIELTFVTGQEDDTSPSACGHHAAR